MGMDSVNILFSKQKLSRRKVKRIYKTSGKRSYGSIYGNTDEVFKTEVLVRGWFIYSFDGRRLYLDDVAKPYHFKDCVLFTTSDHTDSINHYIGTQKEWKYVGSGDEFIEFDMRISEVFGIEVEDYVKFIKEVIEKID